MDLKRFAQDSDQVEWTAVFYSRRGDRKEVKVRASGKEEAREKALDIAAGWSGEWKLMVVG